MRTLTHEDTSIMEQTIRSCSVCFVGLADTDGTPYVIPMNFGYKDGCLYIHSAQEGRSIDIINRNPQICVTFSADNELVYQHEQVACSYRMKAKSVIAWGKVAFVEDFDAKVEALNIIMKQYSEREFKYSDPAVNNVKIWKVSIEKISCKEFGAPHGNKII